MTADKMADATSPNLFVEGDGLWRSWRDPRRAWLVESERPQLGLDMAKLHDIKWLHGWSARAGQLLLAINHLLPRPPPHTAD